MSWIDRINNVRLKIVTGEGSEFFPLYKTPSRSRNMNASIFNFNNVEGSLVRRRKAEGMRYSFEFHFTGEDHLDEAERFNIASLDKRPWTISVAEYGDILVQPINLNFGNSVDNDTVITGEWFETIQDTYPQNTISVKEEILESVDFTIDASVQSFNIESPSVLLSSTSTKLINQVFDIYKLAAITDVDLQAVQDAYNEAITALNNITTDSLTFMQKAAELYRTPSNFYAKVNDRIDILANAYNNLKLTINTGSSVQEKLYFETVSSIIISAMAESSAIQVDEIAENQEIEDNILLDYQKRSEVIDISDIIKLYLDEFFNTLGTFQSDVDATPNSYTPQQNITNAIKDTITKASGQLIQLLIDTKQERKYTVPQNVGIIILVHRLLNSIDSDVIRTFSENNDILLSEWLQIKKGREVIYYL